MEYKPPPSSCVSQAATSTMSADESSWAMHIANFLVSTPQEDIREMDQQQVVSGGNSFSSGFSSSFDSFGDSSSFITSELMCDDDEEYEALQDTACSSAAAGQKIATMENFNMKSVAATDAKEFNMPHLMARYLEAMGSKQQATGVDQQAINSFSNEKALYESNELRKKGLCLVPISMLINYLG